MEDIIYSLITLWFTGAIIRSVMHLYRFPQGAAYIIHRVEEDHGDHTRGEVVMLLAIMFFSVIFVAMVSWPKDLWAYGLGFFRPLTEEELIAEIDAAFHGENDAA